MGLQAAPFVRAVEIREGLDGQAVGDAGERVDPVDQGPEAAVRPALDLVDCRAGIGVAAFGERGGGAPVACLPIIVRPVDGLGAVSLSATLAVSRLY